MFYKHEYFIYILKHQKRQHRREKESHSLENAHNNSMKI